MICKHKSVFLTMISLASCLSMVKTELRNLWNNTIYIALHSIYLLYLLMRLGNKYAFSRQQIKTIMQKIYFPQENNTKYLFENIIQTIIHVHMKMCNTFRIRP